MRGNWDKVNQAIRGALSTVSLEDMTPSLLVWDGPKEVAQLAVQGAP
jgi:DNA-binding IscR family transcriptional regulator